MLEILFLSAVVVLTTTAERCIDEQIKARRQQVEARIKRYGRR